LAADPWRYAICNELFEGWALGDLARFVAGLGYRGLELAPYTLARQVRYLMPADRAKIREAIESAGISVAGLHWLLARTDGLYLNDPASDVRERAVQYLLDEIDLCADLGGDVLVFGCPAQRNPRSGCSQEEAWAYTLAAMRRCGERAAGRGVVFCIEPLAPPDCCFITAVDEAASLVREVDHPGFRMMVDVRAMAADPRPIPEQIRMVAPLIHHVHLNDPNRLGPGMGDLDFGPILVALSEVGYRGWLSVEAFDAEGGIERIARESMAYLRACRSG